MSLVPRELSRLASVITAQATFETSWEGAMMGVLYFRAFWRARVLV